MIELQAQEISATIVRQIMSFLWTACQVLPLVPFILSKSLLRCALHGSIFVIANCIDQARKVSGR